MRAIHLARLDKTRPVLVLTRPWVQPHLTHVTVAPITTRIRGISVEVPVGPANGLEHASVVNCDGVQTIFRTDLGRHLGYLRDHDEPALAAAILAAFNLSTALEGR